MNLDAQVTAAVEKHRRLLCLKTIELALGELVSLDGTREVRKILLSYLLQLRGF
jgi:hypothetical protein